MGSHSRGVVIHLTAEYGGGRFGTLVGCCEGGNAFGCLIGKDIEVKRDVELGHKAKVFMNHSPQIQKIFVKPG